MTHPYRDAAQREDDDLVEVETNNLEMEMVFVGEGCASIKATFEGTATVKVDKYLQFSPPKKDVVTTYPYNGKEKFESWLHKSHETGMYNIGNQYFPIHIIHHLNTTVTFVKIKVKPKVETYHDGP